MIIRDHDSLIILHRDGSDEGHNMVSMRNNEKLPFTFHQIPSLI